MLCWAFIIPGFYGKYLSFPQNQRGKERANTWAPQHGDRQAPCETGSPPLSSLSLRLSQPLLGHGAIHRVRAGGRRAVEGAPLGHGLPELCRWKEGDWDHMSLAVEEKIGKIAEGPNTQHCRSTPPLSRYLTVGQRSPLSPGTPSQPCRGPQVESSRGQGKGKMLQSAVQPGWSLWPPGHGPSITPAI